MRPEATTQVPVPLHGESGPSGQMQISAPEHVSVAAPTDGNVTEQPVGDATQAPAAEQVPTPQLVH
ncbi:MAG: hypothetical protein R3B40_31830 [Polyangiales bacterium]